MWREALTFVGQPTLLSGRPRDTQEIEDGQRTRWRDDLDSKETTTATATATAMGLLRKTTTLHLHHALLYISLPSLYDYDVKMPNFTLYQDVNKRQRIFPFSF